MFSGQTGQPVPTGVLIHLTTANREPPLHQTAGVLFSPGAPPRTGVTLNPIAQQTVLLLTTVRTARSKEAAPRTAVRAVPAEAAVPTVVRAAPAEAAALTVVRAAPAEAAAQSAAPAVHRAAPADPRSAAPVVPQAAVQEAPQEAAEVQAEDHQDPVPDVRLLFYTAGVPPGILAS